MSPSPDSLRERALSALRLAVDLMRERGTHPGDEEGVRWAIATACDSEGISPQDYDHVVRGDPDLEQLELAAFEVGVAGTADPGPYAAISRESMSGKPGDLSKSRTNPDPPKRERRLP